MTIRLLLADDHALVRRGLQVFLATQPDLELVGEAATGQEVLEKVAELLPDVVLMDLNMPILNGIEATKRIQSSHPAVKIIVLTSFSDQDHVLPAIRAGAKGYLLKDVQPEQLVEAIRRVFGGQVHLHPEAASQLMNSVSASEPNRVPDTSPTTPLQELTNREREVLRQIASGKSNKEIGDLLYISEKTVKSHVSHLLDKLSLSDRTQAAIYAIKHGLE